jgi:hypothetical protein
MAALNPSQLLLLLPEQTAALVAVVVLQQGQLMVQAVQALLGKEIMVEAVFMPQPLMAAVEVAVRESQVQMVQLPLAVMAVTVYQLQLLEQLHILLVAVAVVHIREPH